MTKEERDDEMREIQEDFDKLQAKADRLTRTLAEPKERKKRDARAERLTTLKAQRDEIRGRSGLNDHNAAELFALQRQIRALEADLNPPESEEQQQAPVTLYCEANMTPLRQDGWCGPCGRKHPGVDPLPHHAQSAIMEHVRRGHGLAG